LQPLWEIRDFLSEGSEGNLKSSEKSFGYSEKSSYLCSRFAKEKISGGRRKRF